MGHVLPCGARLRINSGGKNRIACLAARKPAITRMKSNRCYHASSRNNNFPSLWPTLNGLMEGKGILIVE